jgi:hypothetical protein
VPQQMFSHNDNDPVNKYDPTGGQTAYDFRTDRIFSDPNKAAEFHEANVKLAEAIFVNEWKTEGGNWWADTGLSVLQKTVQGVVIAPLAIGIVGPVVAAAPAVGTGLSVFGLGAGTFQTASDISNEGLTPDNTADIIFNLSAIPTIRALLGGRVTTPARSTATGSAAVSAADEITEVTQITSRAVCKKCEPLDLWAAERANADDAIDFNDLMNGGANKFNPYKTLKEEAARAELIFKNNDYGTCASAAIYTAFKLRKYPFIESEILSVTTPFSRTEHSAHAIVRARIPGNPDPLYLTWGEVFTRKQFARVYARANETKVPFFEIRETDNYHDYWLYEKSRRGLLPRPASPEWSARQKAHTLNTLGKLIMKLK